MKSPHSQKSIKLNVGCGLDTAPGYENLDNSLSLDIQRNLFLRAIAKIIERISGQRLYTRFPEDVRKWDLTRGLPYVSGSVEVVCSSHTLEHLPREEAEAFLHESYRALAPGGVLRLAVPDLERKARDYLKLIERAGTGEQVPSPADEFMRSTLLGVESRLRLRTPVGIYRALFARHVHQWMWDAPSLIALIQEAGFREVHQRGFHESRILEVGLLDLESRKKDSFYVEARK